MQEFATASDFNQDIQKYLLFSLLYGKKSTSNYRAYILTFILFLVFPVTNYIGSFADNTLIMPGNGKGLFQHYGVWAFYITNPFVCILSLKILKKFHSLFNNINAYLVSNEDTVKELCFNHLSSLFLRKNSKYILYLMFIIGIMFSVINVLQTIDPFPTYGNDVYDSYPYLWGFIANKVHLCFIWSYLYPIAFYIILHTTISMIIILKHVHRNGLLRLDFFAPDGCCGISEFGTLNTLIVVVYFLLFFVMVLLNITHTNEYMTLYLPLTASFIVFIIQSFLGVYYLHVITKNEKQNQLRYINSMLSDKISNIKQSNDFPYGLIQLRKYLLSLKTYPYTKAASLVINGIRLFPPILAIGKLFIVP